MTKKTSKGIKNQKEFLKELQGLVDRCKQENWEPKPAIVLGSDVKDSVNEREKFIVNYITQKYLSFIWTSNPIKNGDNKTNTA